LGKVIPLRRSDDFRVTDEDVRMAMKRQRRRDWSVFADKLRTVVGIMAVGVFFGYLVLSWMAGEPW